MTQYYRAIAEGIARKNIFDEQRSYGVVSRDFERKCLASDIERAIAEEVAKRVRLLEAVADAALEVVHQRDAIMEAGLRNDMAGMDQLIGDGREIEPHLRATLRAAGYSTAIRTPAPGGSKDERRWPRAGDQMRFLGRNGHDFERDAAMKVFEVGALYKVADCQVYEWDHKVSFEGIAGKWNGVMFELVDAS